MNLLVTQKENRGDVGVQIFALPTFSFRDSAANPYVGVAPWLRLK